MKFKTLFKSKETRASPAHSWRFACNNPKTDSFRATGEHVYKSINSVFFVSDKKQPQSFLSLRSDSFFGGTWFSNMSESSSFSTAEMSSSEDSGESVEWLLRGLSSERFFFEPGETNSILEEAKEKDNGGDAGGLFPFKESVLMAMDSEDPYLDFRVSMEEMVEAHGLTDWSCLEELLQWYLRVNGKKTHEFIVGAFVDLPMDLVSSSSSSSSLSSSPSIEDNEENFRLEMFD